MTILEVELDPCVAPGFVGGPEFQTEVVDIRNGHEVRNGNWIVARHRFTAAWTDLTRPQYNALRAMFLVARGMLHGFLFEDPGDYEADNEPLGTTPSGSTPVQLIKTVTVDSVTYVRTITRPRSTGFVMYEDGVPKAGSLNTDTGVFTPTAPWTAAKPLTWDGTFLTPVRFASDWFPMQFDSLDNIEGSVELLELLDE